MVLLQSSFENQKILGKWLANYEAQRQQDKNEDGGTVGEKVDGCVPQIWV